MKQHDGYLQPDGMAWRVNREQALLLGGSRALLLQAAHPLVVQGVADHSNYKQNPWARLRRTVETMGVVIYGSREDADKATARVRWVHSNIVSGTLKSQSGPFAAGTPYSAGDPELVMWVHATLVDTALRVYQEWVQPLSEEEQAEYYEEMKIVAKFFGATEDVIPPDIAAFRNWWEQRLASDEICVSPTALEVGRTVIHPPLPLPLQPAMRIFNNITADLMPAELAKAYGLRWGPRRANLLRAPRRVTRDVLTPLTPDLLRGNPAARVSEGHPRFSPVFSLLSALSVEH